MALLITALIIEVVEKKCHIGMPMKGLRRNDAAIKYGSWYNSNS
ncbi:MAG: hypothetical protein ABJB11_02900 [Ferruginibacter sp.]